MSQLIEEGGRPLPVAEAAHRIACVLKFIANSPAQDGEEGDDET